MKKKLFLFLVTMLIFVGCGSKQTRKVHEKPVKIYTHDLSGAKFPAKIGNWRLIGINRFRADNSNMGYNYNNPKIIGGIASIYVYPAGLNKTEKELKEHHNAILQEIKTYKKGYQKIEEKFGKFLDSDIDGSFYYNKGKIVHNSIEYVTYTYVYYVKGWYYKYRVSGWEIYDDKLKLEIEELIKNQKLPTKDYISK